MKFISAIFYWEIMIRDGRGCFVINSVCRFVSECGELKVAGFLEMVV